MGEDRKKMKNKPSKPKMGWWKIQFIVAYKNEEKNARWHIDPLIAFEILKKILARNKRQIQYWRFHRVNDPVAFNGHQFNFIFYCDQPVAGKIYESIKKNILIKKLKKNRDIVKIVYPDRRKLHSRIEDQSEQNWDPLVQRAWPRYAMGLSEMWLELVELVRQEIDFEEAESNIDTLISSYKEAENKLDSIWRENGGHAILHMAHSVMGWEPVSVTPRYQSFEQHIIPAGGSIQFSHAQLLKF